MKHSFVDKYSDLNSLVHRLDPRTKLLSSLLFIIAVVITPSGNWRMFAFYFGIIIILLILSRLPIGYVISRVLTILPFVVLIGFFIPFFKEGQILFSLDLGIWNLSVTHEGLQVFINICIKSVLSILILVLLSSTTKIETMLSGLKQIGAPLVFVLILSFMYRYMFILVDQVMRMKQARDSHSFGGSGIRHIKYAGNMIGTLFIRSYERGERVYAAMLARGYNGVSPRIQTLRFQPLDAYYSIAVLMLIIWPALLWW